SDATVRNTCSSARSMSVRARQVGWAWAQGAIVAHYAFVMIINLTSGEPPGSTVIPDKPGRGRPLSGPPRSRRFPLEARMAEHPVIIFDTTLRDGEQAPGFSMRIDEKLRLARQLDELGVDVIEAGFPIASEADAEAVRIVAAEVRPPVIAALAACAPGGTALAGRRPETPPPPRHPP